MKTLLMYFHVVLLICGVFGADEVKTVTVMEGEFVTLNPDLTQIQGVNEILWWFGGSTIAQTDGNDISYEDVKGFKGRLKLDQTGSLNITNVRINHSGLYEAEIRHNTGTSNQKFSLTVYESPSVFAGAEAQLKLMSVKKGDPVTLHVPQIQGDELIVWRFGDEGKLIAKADIEAKSSSLYDKTDERFRDRLKLDQTGSLTITNTRTTDSGEYKVKISSNKQTLYKRFTVTVTVPVPDPGFSGGAVAGIVIGVLLLAAAAAGVIYYLRPRTTNLSNETLRETEGDPVTLNPETEIQRGDEIQLFGAEDSLIAEFKGKNREMKTYKGPDERFMNTLELETTGSLTITNITTKHTGLYTLKIRRGRGRETLHKRFMVYVEEREIRVMEGKSVTLKPVYEIKKDDLIQWLFGDEVQQTLIDEFNVKTGEILTYADVADVADGRFRDRLELNKTTGSLIIKNTRTAHTGVYKLEIISSSGVTEQTFTVTVCENVEEIFLEEDSVTLKPDNKIQSDDRILWMFGDQDKLLAQMRGTVVKYDDDANEGFRGRLELDKTGSLTIREIKAEHTGRYKVQIISSSGGILYKRFKVSIQLKHDAVTAGESVRLYAGLVVKKNEEIEWRFGDENSLIAEIKGGSGKTHDGPDGIFRDRLELNEKTGDLIIKKSTDEHTGRYRLKISSSEEKTNRTYTVKIKHSRGNRENDSVNVEMEKKPLLK